MKNNIKIVVAALMLLASVASFGQAPGLFNYQAVLRNSNGAALANQSVNLVFDLYNNPTGAAPILYQETFSATTNANGVVNLQVGANPSVGNLSNLNWSAGPYYVNILLNNVSIYGSGPLAQLVSVPYALYANKADTASVAINAFNSWNDYAVYEYQCPANGGSTLNLPAQTWTTIPLNYTQSSNGNNISRSGSIITLAPGTYAIQAYANAYACGDMVIGLNNGSNFDLIGEFVYTGTSPTNTNISTPMIGVLTINSTTQYQLQIWNSIAASNALGGNSPGFPLQAAGPIIQIQKIK